MAQSTTRRELLKWYVSAPFLAMSKESAAATLNTALLADPVYKEHDPGWGHPERPERYDAVVEAFTRAGLTKSFSRIHAPSPPKSRAAPVPIPPYTTQMHPNTPPRP